MLWELLPAGVKVYYQPPPFAHTKLFAVDDNYSLIGSSNLDPRSLRLNFEIGIEIFDSELNGSIFRYMNGLIGQSRPVTYEEVESRSLPVRFRDSLAWLMSPYL
jgi:cardiolipin synthase